MPLLPPDVRAFQASLPPLEEDWSERANKRAALEAETRNRDAMARANAAEAKQRERALAEADAMQRIATEAAGDWDVMIERATALNPTLGATLTKQRGEAQQATAKAFTEQLSAEQKRTERALSFLAVAQNDPELYDRIAPNIAALLPEELQAALPRTHDPVKIGFLLEATGDAKARQARAAQLHDQVLSGDAFKGVLGQLAEQDTEEEWNGVIQTYAAFLPKGTLALLPKWGPDAPAKAAAMAMTPAQKADDARQVVGQQITLAGQAESQRHNRAMEGHAAASERRLAAGGGDSSPLQAIIGPDGKPVLVRRADAIGKTPAGGSGSGGTATPTSRLNATLTMQNRYNTQTKAAQTSARAVAQMRDSIAAVKAGSMAAGSQGVLVTFQKLLDPESVVRESEYDRSSAGQAMMARLQGQYDRIVSGGAGVPVAELEKFMSLAEAYNRNAQMSAQAVKRQFDAIATEYGLNPENITRDFGGEEATPETPKGGGATSIKATPGDFSAYLNRRKGGK